MRLHYRLAGDAGHAVDLTVDLADDALVGELADHLARYVTDPPGAPTVAALRSRHCPARSEPARSAAPRSGQFIQLLPSTAAAPEPRRPSPVSIAIAGSPPQRLAYGDNTLSVGPTGQRVGPTGHSGADRLDAAIVHVGSVVDLLATGSPVELSVDGSHVLGGARLSHGCLVRFGTVLATVSIEGPLRPPAPAGPVEPIGRTPALRADAPVGTVEVPSPTPPTRLPGFPVLSATVPLLMGAALWVATHSIATAVFVLFSFVFIVASAVESRREARADARFRDREFRRQLDEATDTIRSRSEEVSRVAERASPAAADIVGWVPARSERLWERAADVPGALVVRLGVGERVVVATERRPGGPPEQQDEADRRSAAAARSIVPVTVDLDSVVSMAVVGAGEAATSMTRSLVMQLAGLIGPDELGIDSRTTADRGALWTWMAWLPHAERVAGRRRRVVIVDGPHGDTGVEVMDDLVRDRTTRVIWVATSATRLPRTGAVVVLDGDGSATLRIGDGPRQSFAAEDLLPDEVEPAARSLAPLRPEVSTNVGSTLPAAVTLHELVGNESDPLSSGAVARRWSRAWPSLSAPLGVSSGGVLTLDLDRDGPHALVAGTTGAGKSELLRTMVVSLALHHPPERLTFLLIDYKGGAAFRAVADLPHVVGMVTDLNPSLAQRSLVSLRAELRHRETVLARSAASDLTDLRHQDPTPDGIAAPPALVVVIDEFAALAREIPDFVDGMVDLAQRGRSLGIHLVLATQRPAGVITDAIRANTTLRIALRTADEDDSRDVVDTPAAAHIRPDAAGRGVLRVGPNRSATIQVAYSGGPCRRTNIVRSAALGHDLVALDHRVEFSELDLVVESIARAVESSGRRAPRRPWVEPLPHSIGTDELPTAPRSGRLTIGLVDRPELQCQVPLEFDLDRSGILVVGGAGSGVSTALRTIATTGAVHSLDRFEVYVIDGGHGLADLETLDAVGGVIDVEDVERVLRLLRRLRRPVDTTARRLLILDGLAAFEDIHARVNRGEALELLGRLATEGRTTRTHVVCAATRRAEVPPALFAALEQRIVLRCATEDDALTLGVPGGLFDADDPPGRAVIGHHLAQIALPHTPLTHTPSTAELDRTPQRTASTAGIGRIAPPVPRLPTVVEIEWILERDEVGARRSPTSGRSRSSPGRLWELPVGIDGDDLDILYLDLTHHGGLVAGPPRSGRTNALMALGVGAAHHGVLDRVLVAARRPTAAGAFTTIVGADEHDWPALVAALDAVTGDRPAILAIDDLPELLDGPGNTELDRALGAVLDRGRRAPVRVVVSAEADAASRCYADSMRRIRSGRTGILLRADVDMHAALLHTTLPNRSDLPPAPGRGWLVDPDRSRSLQVALVGSSGNRHDQEAG